MESKSTWAAYVIKVAGTAERKVIADMAKLSASAASRWLTGTTRPTQAAHVAQFAISNGRSPVEAFVAAGLLDLADARKGLSAEEVMFLHSLSAASDTTDYDQPEAALDGDEEAGEPEE